MCSKTKQAEKWPTAYATSPFESIRMKRVTQKISCGKNCIQIDFALLCFLFIYRFSFFIRLIITKAIGIRSTDCWTTTLFLAERLQNRPVLSSIFDDLFRVCVIWCDYIFYFRAISFSSSWAVSWSLNRCICAIVEHQRWVNKWRANTERWP